MGDNQQHQKGWNLHHPHLSQHGRVRGSLRPFSNHGQRKFPVSWWTSAHQVIFRILFITLAFHYHHFRTKFGQGFQIILKLVSKMEARQEEFLNDLKTAVISKFGDCVVTDEHMDYLHFHVANPDTPWHHLFRTMEVMKKDNPYIQDYSISETSLEQVFLSFARGTQSASERPTV